MTRSSKRNQFLKRLANQREAQRKIRKILHENDTSYNAQDHGWDSEEKEDQDAVAIGYKRMQTQSLMSLRMTM
jgi:hypothetical protein